jgi:hypothetical protein
MEMTQFHPEMNQFSGKISNFPEDRTLFFRELAVFMRKQA